MLKQYVLPDGTLNEKKIVSREALYTGLHGQTVERFFINRTESYIFKPYIDFEQFNKELLFNESILIDFPNIYPKVFAHADNTYKNNWIIYEDLGLIRHTFNEEIILEITKLIAWWHQYPTSNLVVENLKGQKPAIEQITHEILLRKEELTKHTKVEGDFLTWFEAIIHKLILNPYPKKVLSHGDLHLGNYGYAKNRAVVIDWEHAHVNIPYWDLYYLIDSTHPEFPKTPNKTLREKALDYYLEQMPSFISDRDIFKYQYYVFTIIFSLWMILLIEDDLKKQTSPWSREHLSRQLKETKMIFNQCVEEVKTFL